MRKILITPRSFARYGAEAISKMESQGYKVHYNNTGKSYTYEEFCCLASDADGIILGVDRMDRHMLEKAMKLRAVSRFGVGIDNIDTSVLKEKNIQLKRTVGSNSISVAELCMAFIFAVSKQLVPSINDVKNGNWKKFSGQELYGKTLGIMGLGAVGREVARIAQGVGMKVIAYDPFVDDEKAFAEYGVHMLQKEDVLSKSDYVTLHMPLTENTRNMIAEKELTSMNKTAFLINTARGELVDEQALYNALYKEEIAGAAQDVFSSEPPKNGEKLLHLDNFYLTPHIASLTKEAEVNSIQMATNNILEMLQQ